MRALMVGPVAPDGGGGSHIRQPVRMDRNRECRPLEPATFRHAPLRSAEFRPERARFLFLRFRGRLAFALFLRGGAAARLHIAVWVPVGVVCRGCGASDSPGLWRDIQIRRYAARRPELRARRRRENPGYAGQEKRRERRGSQTRHRQKARRRKTVLHGP